ncbi:MAG: Hsp20 family protein [Candidatus Berkelbacteria bacterium]|nr:MAG: Hsp20 family protein [Candidatus Berkelbacteria bacterium]QQG51935.1 MAG: Hsp20 family protein [Candidatus Berkelbacteria bacterium]
MPRFRLLLRQLRTQRDLSQEELARELNVSRQSIISLERGEYLPSAPVLISLMEFFRCNLPDLIEGINIVQQATDNEIQEGGEQSKMQLAPWSPFQAMDRMQEEMSEMVNRNFGRGDWSRALGTVAGAMNIHETDKEYEIELQVPGYAEDDVQIEMTEDTLTITGTKKHDENEKEGKNVVRREWQHSEFSRSIRFATPIKEDKVEAKLENGTLKIVAPKVEPAKPKTTKIQVKKK